MNHLLEDVMKLGRATTGVLGSFSVKGRLVKAIRVSRPNWPEFCFCKAAGSLLAQGVKLPHQFTSKVEYLSYLDMQLTRYAAQHPVTDAFPVADELGLKRWEQRWQASRQRPDSMASSTIGHDRAA